MITMLTLRRERTRPPRRRAPVLVCGQPTANGNLCGNPPRCRWHGAGRGLNAAWARSAYRYTSARLRHLNLPESAAEERPSPDGRPDGDGGEPIPWGAVVR